MILRILRVSVPDQESVQLPCFLQAFHTQKIKEGFPFLLSSLKIYGSEDIGIVGSGLNCKIENILQKDENGQLVLNPEVTEQGKKYYVDDYNDGRFPFLPKPYKYLSLAVGYAKERDTALVEVTHITHKPAKLLGNPVKYAWWVQVFHLGKVIEVHRKGEK